MGKQYNVRKHTGIAHPMPLRSFESAYQLIRLDLMESLKMNAPNYFYALPVPPCLEGYVRSRLGSPFGFVDSLQNDV